MRGVIDPYTLGFLLALLGALVVKTNMNDDPQPNTKQSTITKSVNELDL